MMKYIRARLGEHTTIAGVVISLGLIAWSFALPLDRADIADVMRGIAIPIFVALFLWEDKK
jgi:ABC-type uncharacterized transport system permease subunit